MAKKDDGFSAKEKAAMRERAKELKAEARANKKKEDGEKDILEKISEMPAEEQKVAKTLHKVISEAAPELWPKTWYGMPAYAREGKDVVVFFQSPTKFEARYWTVGFQGAAKLDEGNMWPASFALVKLTAKEEKQIAELVKKAAG